MKRATGSIFVYSIQLSTYLFKLETCKVVYTPSHNHVYVFARTYYLESDGSLDDSFIKKSIAAERLDYGLYKGLLNTKYKRNEKLN